MMEGSEKGKVSVRPTASTIFGTSLPFPLLLSGRCCVVFGVEYPAIQADDFTV